MDDAGSDVVEELEEGPGEEEVQQKKIHKQQATLIKGVLQGNEDADSYSEDDAGTDVDLRWLIVFEFVLELPILTLLAELQAQHCHQKHSQGQVQADTAE